MATVAVNFLLNNHKKPELAVAPQVSLDIPLSFYPLSSSSNDNFLAALNQANLEFAILCKNLIARPQYK
jgi:hypothetical protein